MAHESLQHHARELYVPPPPPSSAMRAANQYPFQRHHHQEYQQYRRHEGQERQQANVLPPAYSIGPSGTRFYNMHRHLSLFDHSPHHLRAPQQQDEHQPADTTSTLSSSYFYHCYDDDRHDPRGFVFSSSAVPSASTAGVSDSRLSLLERPSSSFNRAAVVCKQDYRQQEEEEEEERGGIFLRRIQQQQERAGRGRQEKEEVAATQDAPRCCSSSITPIIQEAAPIIEKDYYHGNRRITEGGACATTTTTTTATTKTKHPPSPPAAPFYYSSPVSSIPRPSAGISIASSHPPRDFEYLYEEKRLPDRMHLPPPRPMYVTRGAGSYYRENCPAAGFSGEPSPTLPPPPFTLEKNNRGQPRCLEQLRPRFLPHSQPLPQPNSMMTRKQFKIEDENSIKNLKSFNSSTDDGGAGDRRRHKSRLQGEYGACATTFLTEEENSHGTSTSLPDKVAVPKTIAHASRSKKDDNHNTMLDLLASVATMADSSKGNSKKVKHSSCSDLKSSSRDIGRIISEDKETDDKECTTGLVDGNDRIKTPSPTDYDMEEQPLKTVTPSYSSKIVSDENCAKKSRECDREEKESKLTELSSTLDQRGMDTKSTEEIHDGEKYHNMLYKNSSSLEDGDGKLTEIPRHPLYSSSKKADHGKGQAQRNLRNLHHQSDNSIRDEVVLLRHDLYGKDPSSRKSYFYPHDHVHQYRPAVVHPSSPTRFWNVPRDFHHPRIQPRYEFQETSPNHRFPLGHNIDPFHPFDIRSNTVVVPTYPHYEHTPYPTFPRYEQDADIRMRPRSLPLDQQEYTSQTRKTHRGLPNSKSCNDGSKVILRRKCAWKNYPELEQFLIDNRDEYLRHSAMNYTQEQKQYNNELTERLLEVARKHNYEFDPIDFNFVSIRDRIRCYYKSYVQNCKKRGVSISFKPNKKCKISDEEALQTDSASMCQEEEEEDDDDNGNTLNKDLKADPIDNGDLLHSETKADMEDMESCHGEVDSKVEETYRTVKGEEAKDSHGP